MYMERLFRSVQCMTVCKVPSIRFAICLFLKYYNLYLNVIWGTLFVHLIFLMKYFINCSGFDMNVLFNEVSDIQK